MKTKKLTSLLALLFSLVLLVSTLSLTASAAKNITKKAVTLVSSVVYTGKAQKPKVTVKVSGKKLGTKYYTVTYKNNKNIGKASVTVKGKNGYKGTVTKTFKIVPKKVSGLKATPTANSMKLNWTKVSGATHYRVDAYIGGKWVKKTATKNTSYTVTGLKASTSYQFRVRAYKSVKGDYYTGAYSSKLKASTLKAATAPSAPTGLKATATPTTITLSWNKVSGATGYQVWLYENNSWQLKGTPTSNKFSLSSLSSGVKYSIRIRAYKTSGNNKTYSPYTTISATTVKPQVNSAESLKLSNLSANSVLLQWGKAEGAEGYEIYLLTLDKSGKTITTKNLGTTKNTQYLVSPLVPCGYYKLRVAAFKTYDSKPYYSSYTFSEIFRALPGKVEGLKTIVSSSSIGVTWDKNENADGYVVYNEKGDVLRDLSSSQNVYTLTGIGENESHTFVVKMYIETDGKREYGPEASITGTTGSSKVTSVEITRRTATLQVGKTFRVTASVLPEDAKNKELIFSSSHPYYASIDENGLITALAEGTTKITVKSAENETISDSFTLKVGNVKSTSISMADTTAYEGEFISLNPRILPEGAAPDFTISGSDYTYSYSALFGTKKETLSFSNYFYVDEELNMVKALKETVEPQTGKAFSFNVTLKTEDSGVSCSFKLSATERIITIRYDGQENPWYYGNSAQLSAEVKSGASFNVSQLKWSSSNTKAATVSSDGTVNCVGSGETIIKATSPDGSQSFSYPIYVRAIVKAEKTYFEKCTPGSSYTIKASVLPADSKAEIKFSSSDKSVATVSESGVVSFLKEGNVKISVTSTQALPDTVVLTSTASVVPSGSTAELLNFMESKANAVKSEMPALYYSSYTTFDNVNIKNPSQYLSNDDLAVTLLDYAKPKSKYIASVPASEALSDAAADYVTSIPVAGQYYVIVPGLEKSDIKSLEVLDEGSYTYDIKLVLNDEYMATLPTTPYRTAHGKVFDILEDKYISMVKEQLNSSGSAEMSYSGFAQTYNNSSLTLTIDKVSGDVINMKYDMGVRVEVKSLKLSMSVITAINSDVRFDVRNIVEIEVR